MKFDIITQLGAITRAVHERERDQVERAHAPSIDDSRRVLLASSRMNEPSSSGLTPTTACMMRTSRRAPTCPSKIA